MQRIEPLFTPLYEAIRARHVQSAYFQADETRWKVFAEKAGKTGHLWWLWLFAGEDTVVYVLDPSRSHDVPQSHFPDDVQGVMMVDRYSGYKAMQQVKAGKLLLAFCWAHVRRDFVRVGKGYPELTAWALGWLSRIRELYRLNRERLQHPIDSAEFATADATLRQHVAAMAEERDVELADDKLREPCRKVLVSLNEHWSGLTLFVDDPRIPLDNNYGERLIRNPAVGRKNYYGSGAEWAGRLAMMLFSIFATLVLWKINPRKWLKLVFRSLCRQRRSSSRQSRLLLTVELVGRTTGRSTKFDQQHSSPRHFLTKLVVAPLSTTHLESAEQNKPIPRLGLINAALISPRLRRLFTKRGTQG